MNSSHKRKMAMRTRRIKEGLCVRCGNPRNADGTQNNCRPCADSETERQRKRRRQEGQPDSLLKPRDPEKAAQNLKRFRHARKLEGLCLDCGSSRSFNGTSTRCRPCADEHKEKQQVRRAKVRDPNGILAMQEWRWQQEQLNRIKDGLAPVVIRSKSNH